MKDSGLKMRRTIKASEEARQKRIAKREAHTVYAEVMLYYDALPRSSSSVVASQHDPSTIETIPEFLMINGEKVAVTNRNYEQIIELPEFSEIKPAIEKYIAFVKQVEDWVSDNCNHLETSFSSRSMSRYLTFAEKGKRVTMKSNLYYFDCRLTTHQLRGQAQTEAKRIREDKYDEHNKQHGGKFILAKPIEIRVNKANFESYDAAYEYAINEIQERMKKPR